MISIARSEDRSTARIRGEDSDDEPEDRVQARVAASAVKRRSEGGTAAAGQVSKVSLAAGWTCSGSVAGAERQIQVQVRYAIGFYDHYQAKIDFSWSVGTSPSLLVGGTMLKVGNGRGHPALVVA